ncbi:MAG: MFS family permease [Cocleimonas sp.]|jgi:MFS family permease
MKSYIPLIKNDWRLLMFGFVMMFFSSPGQTYFISLFGGEIRQDLSLSHGEFGGIYSAATLGSALILLWSGTLLDKIDLRKFALGVVIALAVACLLMSTSQNMFMLFLAILGLRQLGQGLMSMSSSSTMMRYIPANKSKANSLASMGYSAAEAMFPSIIILLLLSFTWRQSWLIIALVLVLCVPLLMLFTLREYPKKHQQYLADLAGNHEQKNTDYSKSKRQWTRQEVIRDPLFYLFIPGLVSQSMLYTGFMFHQIHLIEEKTWSLPFWGSLFILFSLTTIVMSLSIGALSDKVGAVKLAPFTGLAGAIGLLVLSSSNSQWVAIAFMLLMAVSTGAQAALSAPFLAERYGNKHFGSIKSLGTFTMVLMSAISPVLIGWFIDQGVSIDTLARSFSIYAFVIFGLAYLAYCLSLKEV